MATLGPPRPRAAGPEAPEALRIALGQAIRRLKQNWRLGVLLAPLLTMRAAQPLGVEVPAGDAPGRPSSSGAADDSEAAAQQRWAGGAGGAEAAQLAGWLLRAATQCGVWCDGGQHGRLAAAGSAAAEAELLAPRAPAGCWWRRSCWRQ